MQLPPNSVARIDACTTVQELGETLAELRKEDEVIKAGAARSREYDRAEAARRKEIRQAEDDETHAIVKRWKKGQKVWFGSSLKVDAISYDFRHMTAVHRYEDGDWAYVWQYQPRARRLWLCKAGKPCEYKHVNMNPLSMRNVRECRIDRTELELRKV